jgi:hypothetical protein
MAKSKKENEEKSLEGKILHYATSKHLKYQKELEDFISQLNNEEFESDLTRYLISLYLEDKLITSRVKNEKTGRAYANFSVNYAEKRGGLKHFFWGDKEIKKIGEQIRVNNIANSTEQESAIEKKYQILSVEIENLKKELNNYRSELERTKTETNELKEIIYENSRSFGSSTKIQTIPVDLYLDTNEPTLIFEVYDAVIRYLNKTGFVKAFEFKEQKGSWIKRMIAKSIASLTGAEVIDRLKEGEYIIEVNSVLKPQSEVDKNQSEAMSNIIASLKDINNAAIRIGSLLVVKMTNNEGEVNVQVRSLSIKELHLINKKPELLHKPQQILTALSQEIKAEENNKEGLLPN